MAVLSVARGGFGGGWGISARNMNIVDVGSGNLSGDKMSRRGGNKALRVTAFWALKVRMKI